MAKGADADTTQSKGTDDPRAPGSGPIGGAANEAGGGFRAALAAYIAAHVLRGQPFVELELLPEAAVPQAFVLEARSAR